MAARQPKKTGGYCMKSNIKKEAEKCLKAKN
nr:MAG TPA: hypothetical protein [Bacteriophage sp.]DAG85819.1 MAG TPA: hypothetical protein [Caudoviricetes sp.]